MTTKQQNPTNVCDTYRRSVEAAYELRLQIRDTIHAAMSVGEAERAKVPRDDPLYRRLRAHIVHFVQNLEDAAEASHAAQQAHLLAVVEWITTLTGTT